MHINIDDVWMYIFLMTEFRSTIINMMNDQGVNLY